MSDRVKIKSYCVKRLRDCGYTVDKLESLEYKEGDARKWSILVDNSVSSVIITCYNNSTFHFYDGERFLPNNISLATDSIEVIVDYLNSRGITNKHPSYGKAK